MQPYLGFVATRYHIAMLIKRVNGNGKGGRPTTVTPEATSKLREVFLLDYTVEEACDYAGISSKAYYRRLVQDEQFRGEMERSQRGLICSAKRAVAFEIYVNKNARIAFDYLKHREPERYSTKIRDASPITGNVTLILPGSKLHPRIIPDEDLD